MSIDQIRTCRWCGHTHGDLCPQVKALELEYVDSDPSIHRVTRVEFFAPVDRIHPELLEAARKIVEGQS